MISKLYRFCNDYGDIHIHRIHIYIEKISFLKKNWHLQCHYDLSQHYPSNELQDKSNVVNFKHINCYWDYIYMKDFVMGEVLECSLCN